MLSSRYSIILAALLFFVAACADDVDGGSVDITVQDSWTQVRIQRGVDSNDDGAWSAEAWFAEFSGVDSHAVREAMNIVDIEAPGCTLVPRHHAYDGDASLRFLAIGAAQLTDDLGTVHPMHPRALALRTDSVHGIVYAARAAHDANQRWRIELTNADGSPRVDLHQDAPQGWGIVAINGDTTFSDPFRLSDDDALTLIVDTDADASLVILRSTSDGEGSQLICGLENNRIDLSPMLLDSLGNDARHIEVQLIMRNNIPLRHAHQTVGDASIELYDKIRVERTRGRGAN